MKVQQELMRQPPCKQRLTYTTGDVIIETASEWEGRGDGAQANCSEHLNYKFLLGAIGSLPVAPDPRKLLIDWLRG